MVHFGVGERAEGARGTDADGQSKWRESARVPGCEVFRKKRQERLLLPLLQARPASCVVLLGNNQAIMSQGQLKALSRDAPAFTWDCPSLHQTLSGGIKCYPPPPATAHQKPNGSVTK